VATAGAAVLGSWAVALLFGEGFDVTRRTITLLTAASCVYLLAMALVNVGVAAGRHHLATWCWTAGSVTFALTLLLADDLLLRVELAYALGSLAAATLALLRVVGLRGQVRVSGARSGRPPAPAS
jgi:O-antigen/teichoic acid export membrane protein